MTYAVKVADLDNLASRTTLTAITELELVARGNDDPDGNLITLQNDHSQLSAIANGRVVMLEESGEITCSFVIEEDHDDHIVPPSQGGAGRQRTTKKGRPLVSILDRIRVRPTLGFGRKPWSRSRPFGFAARGYDPSWWDFATEIVRQGDPSTFYTPYPAAWIDPDASWIGPSSGDDTEAHLGHWYVIGDFTVVDTTDIILFFAADNKATVYFDGFEISSLTTDQGFGKGDRITIKGVTPGVHRIAAKVTNMPDSGEEPGLGLGDLEVGNPTAFLCSCFAINESGRIGGRFIHTDDAWRILEFPDTAPGMTITQIERILLTEAQDDGLAPGVTWDFTDDEFSDGSTAPILESVVVNVGDSNLACLKTWAQTYCDFSMPPDEQLLSMYPFQGAGEASGVTYSPAEGNLVSLGFDAVDVGTDCLIIAWAGGAPIRYPASGGTRMGFLSTNAQTMSEVEAIGEQVLDRDQPEQVTLAIIPVDDDDTPGLGVKIFDTCTVPARPSGTSTERLMEFRKKLTKRGIETAIALRDVHLSDLDRLDLVLQRMLPGAAGGTAPASIADPPPPFGSKINTNEVTFSVPDPVVTGEATKDKVARASGNLYEVAITAKTGGSTDTEFEFLVDGVDVLNGAGVLPAYDAGPPEIGKFTTIAVDVAGEHTAWVEGNTSRLTINITTVGTDVAGLLIEPRFLD